MSVILACKVYGYDKFNFPQLQFIRQQCGLIVIDAEISITCSNGTINMKLYHKTLMDA